MAGSGAICQQCGSSFIDYDASRGDTVCMKCGSVLLENAIVAELEFQETGAGGHSVIGQFVSADNPGKLYLGSMGIHGRESREKTLMMGKRRINELSSQLRVSQNCADMAFNYFKMAVSRGLTKGRRSGLVVASCLYITCRIEGTPHLLLDFCDVLQENVFELGKVYSFLTRSLYINLPPTDPCVYVMRFAHRLNFGPKENEVTLMALRLVQRMKRDWMGIGRRPTGLCGAALLLAARYYEFNRSIGDVVRVVNIGEAAVRKRLLEFEMTPSSSLTLDEFQNVDLEEAADPPAFTESRKKAKLLQEVEASRLDSMRNELLATQKEVEAALLEKQKKLKMNRVGKDALSVASSDYGESLISESQQVEAFVQEEILRDVLGGANEDSVGTAKSLGERYKSLAPTLESLGLSTCPVSSSINISDDIATVVTAEEASSVTANVMDSDTGQLDLTGIDDEELDNYILSDGEVKLKTKIWMSANGEFLAEREELKRKREAEEAERLAKEGETGVKKQRRRRRPQLIAATAGEAIEKIIQERKLSLKINYEVLKTLSVCVTEPPSAKLRPETTVVTGLNEGEGKTIAADTRELVQHTEPVIVAESSAIIDNSTLISDDTSDACQESSEMRSSAALRRRIRTFKPAIKGGGKPSSSITTPSSTESHEFATPKRVSFNPNVKTAEVCHTNDSNLHL